MKTVIYNCKTCKVGRRVEYTVKGQSGTGRICEDGVFHYPGAYVQSCGGGKPTVYGGDPAGLCPSCGKPMAWGFLKATVVEDHVCDSRCTGARGHSCDCSCGGANHGKAWA